MNEIVNITNAPSLTMSSLEIAGLTGKRHDNILRDIRRMSDELGLSLNFEEKPSAGRPLTVVKLPKRETLILVSGYSTELRARIIDRWIELETAIAVATSTNGTVTDMGAEVKKVIGGIVKGIVHKELTEIIPAIVQSELATRNILMRRGKTAKDIWDAHRLPSGLRGATVWLGNRLKEMGACIEFEGRFDRGNTAIRLFDPDKAEVFLKNGLLHKAKVYASERMGQGNLQLVNRRAA